MYAIVTFLDLFFICCSVTDHIAYLKQYVSLRVAFFPLFYLSADESPHLLEYKYVGGWILITPYGKGQVKNPKNKC